MAMMQKKRVLEKVHRFVRLLKQHNGHIDDIPRAITLNYNNVCNFKCEFCFSAEENNEHVKESLSFETIRDLADQADALGIWEVVLTGGELLVRPDRLYELIQMFGPERFHMIIITNGYLMTPKIAARLNEVGLDCVGVSLSGMDAEEHNKSRGNIPDAHQRALDALAYAKAAGMSAWPNVIFGHHNSHSEDLRRLLRYSDERGYSTFFMMAMPFGSFKDCYMDAEDLRILKQLRKEHNCFFDTWDMYDKTKEKLSGCWTVNRTYITPLGDVLVCPYINISIGNIKKQPLKDILDYGFSIKYFGKYCPYCISAHDKGFRKRFLPDALNIFEPLDAHEIFGEEDYIKKEEGK